MPDRWWTMAMIFVGAVAHDDRQLKLVEWKIVSSAASRLCQIVLGVENYPETRLVKFAIDFGMEQADRGPPEAGNIPCPSPDLLLSVGDKERPAEPNRLGWRDVWPECDVLAF
jgi:hypothetical protein